MTIHELYEFMKEARKVYPKTDYMTAFYKLNKLDKNTKLDQKFKNIRYTFDEKENEVVWYAEQN